MATQIQHRRGTTNGHGSFTGAAGEVTIDTDLDVAVVHDGSTAGGFPQVNTTAAQTMTNKTLTSAVLSTGVSGTAVKDEDNMASDSATHLATQQSIKAYVDSQVTAQDLDFSADSGGSLAIDLDSEAMTFTGGTGIDTTGSLNDVSFAIDSTVATLTAAQTMTNKTLTSPVLNTGVSGTAVKDEDNMASDSATHLATQQSIKAYVDSQVTAQDLDFSADSGGSLAIDLDSEAMTFTGGTGIDTTGSLNDVSFAIDSTVATLTAAQTMTNKTLTSAVLNTAVSGTAVKDEDNMISDSATHVATQQSIKAYVDAQVTAQDLDFAGDSGGALSIDLDSESLTIAGGTGLTTAGATNTVTVTLDDTAVSAGSYGSGTAIPTITIDAQGRITAASTATVSSDMAIAADSGTGGPITVGTDTFTVTGGTGIDTSILGDTITAAIDSTVTTLTGSQTLTNKVLTSPSISGNTTFADGAFDFDVASHDGTNGLKLGGTLVTSTAAELNLLDDVTAGTATASKALIVDASKDLTLGTGDFTATDVTVTGTLTESSAAIYKKNINPLGEQLNNIMQLNPVEYDKKLSGEHEYGLIAEEVQNIYPDFVKTKEGKADSLNYSRMVSVLVKAVQELTEKVNKLS